MNDRFRAFLVLGLAAAVVEFSSFAVRAADLPQIARKALYLEGRGGRGARDALALDPMAAAIVAGTWSAPRAGDKGPALEGQEPRIWKEIEADEKGQFKVTTGHLFLKVESKQNQIVRMDFSGHASLFINGVPRSGDPYGFGYHRLPVSLKAGSNDLLISLSGRSPLAVGFTTLPEVAAFDGLDATLPDLLVSEREPFQMGVNVLNATESTLSDLVIRASVGAISTETKLPALAPLIRRKVAIKAEAPAAIMPGKQAVELTLLRGDKVIDRLTLDLRVLKSQDVHKRTFLSAIDGSVQYYAVNPARPVGNSDERKRPALFLSLHGASVEGLGQAQAYGAKSWGHIVAPTNRRPFGFDWEDWGRLDAIEVLDLAQARLGTDPTRTYLTGHSMGGHGTWILGATFPDRFAAIAPSAGWISMTSYAGLRAPENSTPMLALMRRASAPSDTLSLASNYAGLGVYVLHGDADDNVPVNQARQMKDLLSKEHADFHYHEQPKAGHWWSTAENEGTGSACVDWPPIFDLFARRVVPRNDQTLAVDFTTANPGVSARSRWVTISSQLKAMVPSRVRLSYRPGLARFVGTTDNVRRMSIDTSWIDPSTNLTFEIDQQTLTNVSRPADGTVWLLKKDNQWSTAPAPSLQLKGPHREGPFKEGFRHRMIMVYGTIGTPEENAWSRAKARNDAETFGYRGNGSVDVVPDVAFDASQEPDRSVILYGHGESNAAWKALLSESPVQVKRGQVTVGRRVESADDLAVLFLRPRPRSDQASVVVVSGTGPRGLRRVQQLPYFTSGVAYPDLTILRAIAGSNPNRGLVGVGFFGEDWGVDSGEFLFADDLAR